MKRQEPQQIVYVDEAGIDNREDYPYGYCEIGQRFYALKSGKRTERVMLDCRLERELSVCTNDVRGVL